MPNSIADEQIAANLKKSSQVLKRFDKEFKKAAQDLSKLITPEFKDDWLAGFYDSRKISHVNPPDLTDPKSIFYHKGFCAGRKFTNEFEI